MSSNTITLRKVGDAGASLMAEDMFANLSLRDKLRWSIDFGGIKTPTQSSFATLASVHANSCA